MPYIISTKISDDTLPASAVLSRRAVATLEEAHDYVNERAIEMGFVDGWTFPESSGTIGPLPDGTVIEVQRSTWSDLATDLDIELRYDPPMIDGDYLDPRQHVELLGVIDAYNAQQVVRS